MTPDSARAEYEAARTALNKIARSDSTTDAQREAAQAARDQLTIEFIEKRINAGDALSAQYVAFIARMTAVVNDLSRNSPVIEGLKTLQTIVDRSSELLKDR